MRKLINLLTSSWSDLGHSKIKTGLSVLGILIGVFAVVILQSVGNGLNNYLLSQFETLGANTLYIFPGDVFGSRSGGAALGNNISFTPQDVARLQKIPQSLRVVPVAIKRTTAQANSQLKTTDVYATSSDLFTLRNLSATHGELITQGHINKKQKVVVLGPKIAEELFVTKSSAIGKKIKLGSSRYTVIGVIEAQGGQNLGGPDFDSYSYIPYTAVGSLLPSSKFSLIYLQARASSDLNILQSQAEKVLLEEYKPKDFSVIDQGQVLSAANSIFGVVNAVLLVIGSVSLLVGGIGIMNIMYATVTQRIKEIGIRRALGATKADVLSMFLTESILLSLMGGFLGLCLSGIAVFFIRTYFPLSLDSVSILIALGVSSAIGVFFGVFPARNAASWPPIDAIRYE